MAELKNVTRFCFINYLSRIIRKLIKKIGYIFLFHDLPKLIKFLRVKQSPIAVVFSSPVFYYSDFRGDLTIEKKCA